MAYKKDERDIEYSDDLEADLRQELAYQVPFLARLAGGEIGNPDDVVARIAAAQALGVIYHGVQAAARGFANALR